MKRKIAFRLAFVCLVVLLLSLVPMMKTKSVECYLDSNASCPAELTSLLEQDIINRSFFFTDYENIVARAPLASLPFTLSSFKRNLPDKLTLTFKNEPLLYKLVMEDGSSLLIGTEGTIINNATDNNELTQVLVYEDAATIFSGNKVTSKLQKPISAIVESLHAQGVSVESVSYQNSQDIRLKLSSSQVAILDDTDPESAIKKLKLILSAPEVTAIDEPIDEIDLRFKMPVLRTSK